MNTNKVPVDIPLRVKHRFFANGVVWDVVYVIEKAEDVTMKYCAERETERKAEAEKKPWWKFW